MKLDPKKLHKGENVARPLRLIASTEGAALETSARLSCDLCVMRRQIERDRDGWRLTVWHARGCRNART